MQISLAMWVTSPIVTQHFLVKKYLLNTLVMNILHFASKVSKTKAREYCMSYSVGCVGAEEVFASCSTLDFLS